MLSAGEFPWAVHCGQSKKVPLSLMKGICRSVEKDKEILSAFVVPRHFQPCRVVHSLLLITDFDCAFLVSRCLRSLGIQMANSHLEICCVLIDCAINYVSSAM